MSPCLTLLALALPFQSTRAIAPPAHTALVDGFPAVAAAPRLDPGGGYLSFQDRFGSAVAGLGDLDGDGQEDIAVGMSRASSSQKGLVAMFVGDEAVGRPRHFIGERFGGFGGALAIGAHFGSALAAVGDLDGDGVTELAVGAPDANLGAVWIVFLDAHGLVRDEVEITEGIGGFTGNLDTLDAFGAGLGALGDLDGDGVPELAVGAPGDDDVSEAGAVWILFLNADGTVREHRKLGATSGVAGLAVGDRFGSSIAGIGDHDGNGVPDALVGAPLAALGDAGRATVLFLDSDGAVLSQSAFVSPKPAGTAVGDQYGFAVAALGDLDGDGVDDVVVGAPTDEDSVAGAAWVVFLNADGSVKAQQKISSFDGDLPGPILPFDAFGSALAVLSDRNGDGRPDLMVGAPTGEVSAGCADVGEVWLLFLGADGRVDGQVRAGGECSLVPERAGYAAALAELGDMDGDGRRELAVGLPGAGVGKVWRVSLDHDGTIAARQELLTGGFANTNDDFGAALANLGDLDGDGTLELAVGAPDNIPVFRVGAFWVLSLDANGNVVRRELTRGPDLVPGTSNDRIGASLAAIGDVDGDGVGDLAVGAPGFDVGGPNAGAVLIAFLNPDGSTRSATTIDASRLGIAARDRFGRAVAKVADLDGDGRCELAVGAPGHDDGAFADRGEVWILFLDASGGVRSYVRIGSGRGGFDATLGVRDNFGTALTSFPDVDGDGIDELLVGAPGDDRAGRNTGAVWALFLAPDGTVARHDELGPASGFPDVIREDDRFGSSLAPVGDVDGDGLADLALGALLDDQLGPDTGMGWVALLGGAGVIDFSTEDDLATPLVDGQALSTPPEFGRLFRLSASGANLGAAVFDSTPGGPNDPSQDLDLLVDKGNVLILQNSLSGTQTVPGIFDRPNDDSDGGVLRFEFLAPQLLLGLDLADIDLSSGRYARVRLVDDAGRMREYAIPPGWTEDLVTDGAPGWRTLSLVGVQPQPGFQASTTAVQQAGFDPRRVTVLEVVLEGSGAVDDLRFLPRGSE